MITKTINKQPKSQVDIVVTVPWVDLQPKWDETLSKMAQDVELPGFRKGTAPLPMVEQNLGQKLQDEVLRVAMPQFLIEALQGTNIVPIDYPQYQVTSFQKGVQLQFSARVTERPTVTVGSYKTVKVQRPPKKEITEEEVTKIIDELFRRWKLKNPNGPAQSAAAQPTTTSTQGPSGSLSFNASSTPQAPTSNGPARNASPARSTASAADWQSDAGGPDDVFAQGVGAQNLADLKTKIRQDLENEANYNNELDYEEAILQEVEKVTTVDIPEILVQDELNRMLVSLQRSVTERGLLMDEYLRSQNKTADQLKNEWRPQAEKNVRMELGLSEVARLEGVNISEEELQAEIDKIQDQRVKSQFTQDEPRMHLRHALRQTKTLNLLKTIVG